MLKECKHDVSAGSSLSPLNFFHLSLHSSIWLHNRLDHPLLWGDGSKSTTQIRFSIEWMLELDAAGGGM